MKNFEQESFQEVVVTDLSPQRTRKSSWRPTLQSFMLRRRRSILWLVVCMMFGVAILLFAQPFRQPQTPPSTLAAPDQALLTFCALMKSRGVVQAYQQLSSHEQESNPSYQIRSLQRTQQEFASFHGLRDCGVLVMTNNGTRATALLTCSVVEPPRNAAQIILQADVQKEKAGGWKLLNLSSSPAFSDPW